MNTEQNDLLFNSNEVNEALKSASHMDDLFKEGGALQLILKKTKVKTSAGQVELDIPRVFYVLVICSY